MPSATPWSRSKKRPQLIQPLLEPGVLPWKSKSSLLMSITNDNINIYWTLQAQVHYRISSQGDVSNYKPTHIVHMAFVYIWIHCVKELLASSKSIYYPVGALCCGTWIVLTHCINNLCNQWQWIVTFTMSIHTLNKACILPSWSSKNSLRSIHSSLQRTYVIHYYLYRSSTQCTAV